MPGDNGYVHPHFDRSGPAGGLIDSATGGLVGASHQNTGWVRGPDGTAIPEQLASGPPPGAGSAQGQRRDTTSETLLLLFM